MTGENGRPAVAAPEAPATDDDRRQVWFVIGAVVLGFVLGLGMLFSLVLFGL